MDDKNLALTTVTQAITEKEFKNTHTALIKFVKSTLKEGINKDFAVIPYTNKKSLLKPGAEKLAKLFGLTIQVEKVSEVEDWTNNFVFYKYKCVLTHFATGKNAGEAVRSANNKEKKWKTQPVYDVANTVEAMAQKRAIVAAVVQACMASEIFDADIEDEEKTGSFKKEEDPKRHSLLMKLYANATERGFGEEALHTSAKREYGIKESLSELTNGQIEEIIERIVTTFKPVGKGHKPEKYQTEPSTKSPESLSGQIVVPGEIIVEGEKETTVTEPLYYCKGEKHIGQAKVQVPVGQFCSPECKASYWKDAAKDKRPWEKWEKKGETGEIAK